MKQIKRLLSMVVMLLISSVAIGKIEIVRPTPTAIGDFTYLFSALELTVCGFSADGFSADAVIPSTVTIGEREYSVTKIGQSAFRGYEGLVSIAIPESVTSIEGYAFENCNSLASITILGNVKSVGRDAFLGTPWYDNQPDGAVYLKDVLCGYKGEMQPNTAIEVKEGTRVITERAFYDCENLAAIMIPASVINIGKEAFSGCSSLTSVPFPEDSELETIGEQAFFACSSLTTINIPDSVTTIGGSAFYNCSSLTSITLPEGVTNIGGSAFYNCSSLTSITLPEGVTNIGYSAFYNCSSLTAINIPEGVTSIGMHAFDGCSSLTSVVIPDGVTRINSGTFSNCHRLVSVSMSDSVTDIGWEAFDNCRSLVSFVIPKMVKSIDMFTFRNCHSLTSVVLSDSVAEIGYEAFRLCSSLTSISIPKGVTSIRSGAFAECTGLHDVYCYVENVPNTPTDVWNRVDLKNVTLHVPAGALENYKTTAPWSEFGNFNTVQEKCAAPVVNYVNGQVMLTCDTEDAEFHSSVAVDNACEYEGAVYDLTATYTLTAYATKEGYTSSDVVTAILCWVACDGEHECDNENGIVTIPSKPALIQVLDGLITVTGLAEGTDVGVYGMDGCQLSTAVVASGTASISTDLTAGTMAIVKIGNSSVKVVMK